MIYFSKKSFVGFLGFFIPADQGEKSGIGITTLLSMTVFLMVCFFFGTKFCLIFLKKCSFKNKKVIADSMPPNSDTVPWIGNQKENKLFFYFIYYILE